MVRSLGPQISTLAWVVCMSWCAELEFRVTHRGDVGLNPHETMFVRDLWARKSLGSFVGEFCMDVLGHDTALIHVDSKMCGETIVVKTDDNSLEGRTRPAMQLPSLDRQRSSSTVLPPTTQHSDALHEQIKVRHASGQRAGVNITWAEFTDSKCTVPLGVPAAGTLPLHQCAVVPQADPNAMWRGSSYCFDACTAARGGPAVVTDRAFSDDCLG